MCNLVECAFLAALAALYLTLYTYNRREPTYKRREPTYNRGEPLTATLEITDERIYAITRIPLTTMTPTIMTTLIPLPQTTQNHKNPQPTQPPQPL